VDEQLNEQSEDIVKAPQPGDKRWRLAAWMLVVRQNVLPLLVALATIVVFARLGQVQEALFGTIGLAKPSLGAGEQGARQYIGSQFGALAVAIGVFAAAIWYSSRLMLTMDGATKKRLARIVARPHVSRVVEEAPRIIGAVTAAALITALVDAQAGPGSFRRFAVLIGIVATAAPLAAVFYIARPRAGNQRPSFGKLGALVAGSFVLTWILIKLIRPEDRNWSVAAALSLLCLLPALLYAAARWRRALLRRIGFTPRSPSARLAFTLWEGVTRLFVMGFVGMLILLWLARGGPGGARVLGSAAIALLALAAALCAFSALVLVLRFLDDKRPGIVITGLAALLAIYVVGHNAFGWTPFEEQIGDESLSAQSGTPTGATQHAAEQDVIVNAYGGGLRSALFTAQVLAELDDRSCGEFGKRLERLSGVSGGSLGIAAYLLLRQDLVAAGGWRNCHASPLNPPNLALRVDEVLLQDHLSAALARMLSIDLLPSVAPRRGLALLESWQDAYVSQRPPFPAGAPAGQLAPAGFALPLTSLTGGVAPAPAVFFSATRVEDGKRVWFSNAGHFGVDGNSASLAPGFQVGQAVLHSARFPFVSPAGAIRAGGGEWMLVDGGYADNSGAATLLETDVPRAGRHWLNIDGNPPPDRCGGRQPPQERGAFSALDTLLAVRRSQADLAVQRFRKPSQSDMVSLVPDMEAAFKATMEDTAKRCERLRELRSAPLGWYLTPVTVGDQRLARLQAVNVACKALEPLCGTIPTPLK
jgi:hypothetical protein